MESVRFDDIDGINALAGEEFGDWGRSVEVTQEMINDFAELTGDRQWIHIDVERAKGTLITTEAEIAAEGSEKPALLYRMQVLYTPPR